MRLVIPAQQAQFFDICGIFVGVKIQALVAPGKFSAILFADDQPDLKIKYDTAQVSQWISVHVFNNSTTAARISATMLGLTLP